MTSTPATHDPIQAFVEKNYRFNFIFNALDGGFYWFGYSFLNPSTILPLFISHLTTNPVLIGLITFINTAFFLGPQLFSANWIKRAPVKKFFPVNLGFFFERLPVMAFPLIAYFLSKDNPALALTLTLLFYAWYCFGTGLIVVGWQDMIAKIIPVDRRGRFFGITSLAGTVAAILGSLAVTWVLGNYDFHIGFAMSFTAAAVLIFLSWVALAQVREPAVPSTQPKTSLMDFLRTLPPILKRDANFRRYLISQMVISFSGLSATFLVVYPSQRWHMPDSEAGAFNIILTVGQVFANLVLGWLADRKGHKLVIEIGVLSSLAAFVLAAFAPASSWFYIVFFLRGILVATMNMSFVSLPLEFTSTEDRPTYIGLVNTVPGVFSSIAPLLGGWLALTTGYPILFAISAVVALIGLILLRFTVQEPRYHTQVAQ